MVDLANIIRLGRAKKNISQTELAKRLGIAASAISYWESGEKIPSGDSLLKLIEELDLIPELFPGYVKIGTVGVVEDQKIIEEIRKRIIELEQDHKLIRKEHEQLLKRFKEKTNTYRLIEEQPTPPLIAASPTSQVDSFGQPKSRIGENAKEIGEKHYSRKTRS